MARSTDVTCDRCGWTDGPRGATDWIVIRLGKNKHDFCKTECLKTWVHNLVIPERLPGFELDGGETVDRETGEIGGETVEVHFTADQGPALSAAADAIRAAAGGADPVEIVLADEVARTTRARGSGTLRDRLGVGE